MSLLEYGTRHRHLSQPSAPPCRPDRAVGCRSGLDARVHQALTHRPGTGRSGRWAYAEATSGAAYVSTSLKSEEGRVTAMASRSSATTVRRFFARSSALVPTSTLTP